MLAQEGALSDLVQQHLRAKGKLGALRLNKLKKATNGASSNGSSSVASTSTASSNGTERSPKSVKRRRSGKGNNRKKARRKK